MRGSNNRFWGLEPSNTSNNMFILLLTIPAYDAYALYLDIFGTYRHVFTNTHIDIYRSTYVCIYICIYIYMHMHIHTAAFRSFSWHISIHHCIKYQNFQISSVVALRIEAIGEGGLRHHAVLLCEELGSNSFGEFGFLS